MMRQKVSQDPGFKRNPSGLYTTEIERGHKVHLGRHMGPEFKRSDSYPVSTMPSLVGISHAN